MRVLVLGSGGREHALCWAIARSGSRPEVICAPGNPGIATVARCQPVDVTDVEAVVALCRDLRPHLVVVGPEAPLCAGVADALRAEAVAVFGPGRDGARLEGSKAFAKDFMRRHRIPTAGCVVFHDGASLAAYLATCPLPTVVKADGLAAGKGVAVCQSRAEARAAAEAIASGVFGRASDVVLVEEFMAGEEATVLALVDGETIVPLQASQDHKRRFDGDRGPNTGGMGAYSPVPALDAALMARVRRDVLEPAARGLVRDGVAYRGLLYAGLMLTKDGPKVVEFNVRFGDPEAQAVLFALRSDLLPLLLATARGELASMPPPEFHEGASVCVVLAADGYPERASRGAPITGIVAEEPDAVVFHAGTARDAAGRLVAAGGRVLSVTARGPDFAAAIARAYAAVRPIRWDGMAFRSDIGHRVNSTQPA